MHKLAKNLHELACPSFNQKLNKTWIWLEAVTIHNHSTFELFSDLCFEWVQYGLFHKQIIFILVKTTVIYSQMGRSFILHLPSHPQEFELASILWSCAYPFYTCCHALVTCTSLPCIHPSSIPDMTLLYTPLPMHMLHFCASPLYFLEGGLLNHHLWF